MRSRRENKTVGQVISELARQALTVPAEGTRRQPKTVHGFRPFPNRGGIVTNEFDRQVAGRRRLLMRGLLDVNILIALLDADHSLHTRARGSGTMRTPDGRPVR